MNHIPRASERMSASALPSPDSLTQALPSFFPSARWLVGGRSNGTCIRARERSTGRERESHRLSEEKLDSGEHSPCRVLL